MKKTILLSLILTGIFSFAIISNAQQTKAIPEEKNRLIAELIVLTKTDQQIVEITDTLLVTMQENYPAIVDQMLLNNPNLTADEKSKMKEGMVEGYKSFSKKFRERLPKEIDYPKYIKDVVYPLYDKYFTETELKDLVAFYKTETGKKVITAMPQLFADSEKLSQTYLLPQILQLVDKILKEDLEKSENTMPPPKPDNR